MNEALFYCIIRVYIRLTRPNKNNMLAIATDQCLHVSFLEYIDSIDNLKKSKKHKQP